MTRYWIFLVAACFGCSGGEAPTFNRDIAPIVFHNCAPCHRPAGPAPFDLLSYENVSARCGANRLCHRDSLHAAVEAQARLW